MTKPKIAVLLPVLITEDWQFRMTECAIKTMSETTDIDYFLIVVETGEKHRLIDDEYLPQYIDSYIHRPEKTTIVQDLNIGIDAAMEWGADYIVHTANDIFTKPGWLEALLEPFERFEDCGVSCLAASDLKQQPGDMIMEGMYGPLMMFRAGVRFDEDFENIFSDSDLIMRIYRSGYRSYRNWKVCITHLYQQTYSNEFNEAQRKDNFDRALQKFMHKHNGCGLFVYRAFVEGFVL